jgi:LPS-assembly lipoprotein
MKAQSALFYKIAGHSAHTAVKTVARKVSFKHFMTLFMASLMLVQLSGCSFKLRGHHILPKELQTLYVSSVDVHGELTRLLKRHLIINNVTVKPIYSAAIPELRILYDALNRRTLSVFSNGQVAESELIYSVAYEVRINNKEPQTFRFDLTRDYQDDPNVALAKSRELALLLSEMRNEATNRILRNLSTVNID